jgi:formiminotetrahydrofolate cyclodeaminase
LRGFDADVQVLERRVRAAVSGGPSVGDFLAAIAGPSPTPGGGSVVAHVAALAGSLVQMVAGLTAGRPKFATVDAEIRQISRHAAGLTAELAALVDRDAAAYGAVSAAYKIPKTDPAREAGIIDALLGAARVPLETAQAAARVAALAAAVAEKGNPNAVSDGGVAALLAEAACRGAAYNVRINIAALPDRSLGERFIAEANEAVIAASTAAQQARTAVERHL